MKLRVMLGLMVAGLCFSVNAQNAVPVKAKLSPQTKQFIAKYREAAEKGELPEGFVLKNIKDRMYAGSLIKISDGAAAENGIRNLGGIIATKAGDIWSVKMPVENVEAFTKLGGISYIQVDEPVFPAMDIVRKTTRTDSVHNAIGLSMPYTGKGVVMGIIDFGFDYNHPAVFDTTGTQYRIKRVWELNANGNAPAPFNYGHEISDSTQLMLRKTDNSHESHGACVQGVAAGSGVGSGPPAQANRKSRGIAFESELVFVSVRRDSIEQQWKEGGFSDFVDAIQYIFNYAGQVAYKPAVVNISWGSQSGPHDGSSLFNQAVNNMSGPGRIVVMSAGNDGEDEIHLSKTFSANDSVLQSFLSFSPTHYQRTWLDAWGEAGKTICAEITLYKNGIPGNTTGKFCIDDQVHVKNLIGSNGNDTCYVEFISAAAEYNDKPRMTVSVFNRTVADSVVVTFTSNDGKFHIWNEYYYYGFPQRFKSTFDNNGNSWATKGNTASTTSDMGSGESVLLVGAYASKVAFNSLSGGLMSYAGYVAAGDVVPFSSRGPMVDGTVKPDISAPGLTLNSAYNSMDSAYLPGGASANVLTRTYTHPVSGKKYYYGEFIGTSASGPVASGIVALMLHAHPGLTPADVKKILFETAIQDNFTGTLPASGNNTWGHGKINAYGAIKAALVKAGTYTFSGKKLDAVIFPNPNGGAFTLTYSSVKDDEITIEIYDMKGSLVHTQKQAVTIGENQFEASGSKLIPGVYVVKVSNAEGTVTIRNVVQ